MVLSVVNGNGKSMKFGKKQKMGKMGWQPRAPWTLNRR
jgi:hypothetical protein